MQSARLLLQSCLRPPRRAPTAALLLRSQQQPLSSSSASGGSTGATSHAAASGGPVPTAGLGGVRGGKGGLASIFDRSLKQHYHSNKAALDRIALSFLFFYCTGHLFMQKQRCTELEEELALVRREKKGLEAVLRDEAWAKDVSLQLGLRDPRRLLAALARAMKENSGELTREDMALPTMTAAATATGAGEGGAAAAASKPGNALF